MSDFKAKMHQTRFPLTQTPSCILGTYFSEEGEVGEGEGKGRGKERGGEGKEGCSQLGSLVPPVVEYEVFGVRNRTAVASRFVPSSTQRWSSNSRDWQPTVKFGDELMLAHSQRTTMCDGTDVSTIRDVMAA